MESPLKVALPWAARRGSQRRVSAKTKPLVLLPPCQPELLAGMGGFPGAELVSGLSGEKSPSCPWGAGHV